MASPLSITATPNEVAKYFDKLTKGDNIIDFNSLNTLKVLDDISKATGIVPYSPEFCQSFANQNLAKPATTTEKEYAVPKMIDDPAKPTKKIQDPSGITESKKLRLRRPFQLSSTARGSL